MNWRIPPWAVLFEAIATVHILTAPLVKGSDFDSAACSLVAAEEVMDEDEFEFRPALLERLFEPPILRLAQRPPPSVAAPALLD